MLTRMVGRLININKRKMKLHGTFTENIDILLRAFISYRLFVAFDGINLPCITSVCSFRYIFNNLYRYRMF